MTRFILATILLFFGALCKAEEKDYFSPENSEIFLEYEPFEYMYLPLGITPEGYQYGAFARVWVDSFSDEPFACSVLLADDMFDFYIATKGKNCDYEVIYINCFFDGDNEKKYRESKIATIERYSKSNLPNIYNIFSDYRTKSFERSCCYFPHELEKMKQEAEKKNLDAYHKDILRACIEQLSDYKKVKKSMKENAELAMKTPAIMKFINGISSAYSQGGVAYIPSVAPLPKKRKIEETEAKPQPVVSQEPKKPSGPKKDKHGCIAFVDGEKVASVKSKDVSVLQYGPRYTKVSWTIKVKNISDTPLKYWVRVRFYDSKGFMLDDSLQKSRLMYPGETGVISDTTTVDTYHWDKVKTKEFTVEATTY